MPNCRENFHGNPCDAGEVAILLCIKLSLSLRFSKLSFASVPAIFDLERMIEDSFPCTRGSGHLCQFSWREYNPWIKCG